MPGRSICRLGRLSYVKLAFGKHACLRISFDLGCGYPSYVNETPSPETEKPPSLEFRDRCRVEGQVGQILFALDLMKFDKEHIEVTFPSFCTYRLSRDHMHAFWCVYPPSLIRNPVGSHVKKLSCGKLQPHLYASISRSRCKRIRIGITTISTSD
jgi:hypothetical protein